jgi:outer membrane lipoprotein-sorting protein
MNNQFNRDEEMLARLVREAGDPSISPDPLYANTLRATILDRVGPEETVASGPEADREAGGIPAITKERAQTMKRITKLAVAATILMAFGSLVFWMTSGGGSTNIAFAEVAKALDSMRSVTYDFTSEIKSPVDGKTTTINTKGYFLAPSLERAEMSMSIGSAKDKVSSIMILDCLAAKGITLLPEQKKAMIINISTTEKSTGGTSNMFETVRRLIREGSTSSGEKVESLGKKEIDGSLAVGFRTRNNMADMSLWADPQTARLVRVEFDRFGGDGHAVMSNFHYDMKLDPSLFSLEPPAGYTVETQTVTKPVEKDLVKVLRLVAEYNEGTFPDSIGTNNKTFMQALQAETKSETEKLLKTPEAQELMEKLKAQYGEDKQGFMKAWMKEWMEMAGPTMQKHTQKYMKGVMFYATLQPENDSHYAGKDVKLDTPDRPILWYKPTGTDKYRVIYADLSVKDMSPEDVKNLPKAKAE